MKPLNVYIGGNIYRAGNIGDDSVLEGILKIVNKINRKIIFTIGTKNGHILNISYPNVQVINCYNKEKVINAIVQSDIVICGGGTLIGDELGIGFPLEYTARIISQAKLLNKKVFLFSIGANELKTKKGRKIIKKIYGLADCISVRDKESALVCKKLIQNKEIFITADPAFILLPEETKRIKNTKNRYLSKKKYFGVNVVNEVWKAQKDYKKIIAEVCDYVYNRYNLIPVFFCNEIRNGKFFDNEANNEVKKNLNCESISLDQNYYSPSEMIELISNFKFIISMRMHSLIFASLTNTPFITISRIDKVDNLMKIFDLKSSCTISDPDKNKIINDIDYVLKEKKHLMSNINKRVFIIKKEVLKNKFIFENIIKQKNNKFPKFNLLSLKYIDIKSMIKYFVKRGFHIGK